MRFKQRSGVFWADRNFVREHCIRRPNPAWSSRNPKWAVLYVVALFVLVIASVLLDPVRLPFLGLLVLTYPLLMTNVFMAELRAHRFYQDALRQGGETVNPWNMKLIRRIYGGHLILYPLFMTSFFLLLGLLLYEELKSPRAGFEVYPLFFEIGITPGLYIFSIQTGGFTASPYIFMDISEGMLFGGALFAYDTLRDVRPVKKENNYELFYEGKKAAAFVMLPDDMNYLREVLALRGKYAEHLE